MNEHEAQQEVHFVEEEHFSAMEAQHYAEQDACKFERPTGDKRWPVLCQKDLRYASPRNCFNCRDRRLP